MASLGLIFVAPLMLVIALAIKVQDGGPALFGQVRIGRGGRRFLCWKFRSMAVASEAKLAALLARDPDFRREWLATQKLRRDPRVTFLGRFLRRSSLDELPQLFNIIRGDMSIVGPRPIIEAEVVRYGRYYRDYCRVRPGLTGLWQVSGRSNTSYRRRVAMDVTYARSRSLRGDLMLIAKTIPAVASKRGSF